MENRSGVMQRISRTNRESRINGLTSRCGQLAGSCLRAVDLKDVGGDIHCGVVIDAVELERRVTDCYLKTRDEFGHCFLAPSIEKSLAGQWRNMVWISDEFLIAGRQGAYGRKFAIFSLASRQGICVAFPASVLVCSAARFSLSGSENAGRRLLFSGQNEVSSTEYGDGQQTCFAVHLLTPQAESGF